MRFANTALLLVTAIIALLALTGNALVGNFVNTVPHDSILSSWSLSAVSMKATTGWILLEHVYTGWLLSSKTRPRSIWLPMAVVACASLGMTFGVTYEIFTAENLHSFDPKKSFYPSLMTIIAAAALSLKGLSALRWPHVATLFSALAATIGGSCVLGYVLHIPVLYYFVPEYLTAMAIPTGWAFLFLGLVRVDLDYTQLNDRATVVAAIQSLQGLLQTMDTHADSK